MWVSQKKNIAGNRRSDGSAYSRQHGLWVRVKFRCGTISLNGISFQQGKGVKISHDQQEEGNTSKLGLEWVESPPDRRTVSA